MSESRKTHLSIDGGQVKEDDTIASYKAIPESDLDVRPKSLSKSKEKLSDEAQERLLQEEDQAKIVTRVDMADAKYVVGDHRNGDAKIELDANKKQFTGLTKEELMKYADDPFWVRLRWCMFVLFWALWLAMLAGAVFIIVRAPACAAPTPKTWYEKGPLVDLTSEPISKILTYQELLANIQEVKAQAVFVKHPDAYKVLEDDNAVTDIRNLVVKAKEFGFKVIVDLTASFVPKTHKWFESSVNRSSEFDSYFIWANDTKYDEDGHPKAPNNWTSELDTPAWAWNEGRKQFYYHLYGEDKPQLNFSNPDVVKQFDEVLKKYMRAGAAGIRLIGARDLLIDPSLSNEVPREGAGSDLSAVHSQRAYYVLRYTSDRPALDDLLAHWAYLVDNAGEIGDTPVFTLREDGSRPEFMTLGRGLALHPPAAAPVEISNDAVRKLTARVGKWPVLELRSHNKPNLEVSAFGMLLPAAPVINGSVLSIERVNNSAPTLEAFSRLSTLRQDASIEHGNYSLVAVTALNGTEQLVACARWKLGHTGYVAVHNPHLTALRVDLSSIASVPSDVTTHYAARDGDNYTLNQVVKSESVLVSGQSTLVFSYVPKTTVEK